MPQKRQAAFEAKVSAEERAAREAAERVRMREEEIMCLVPPLTVPATPRVVAANAHTLWVEWTAAKADARGVRQLPGTVKYVVSMQGGFAVLVPGAEVIVSYEGKGKPGGDDDEGKSSRPQGPMGLPAKAKGVQTPKMRKKREAERKDRESRSNPNSRPGSRGGDGSMDTLSKATSDLVASRVFRGILKTDNRDGTFNIEYADGGSEQGVPRRRILPAKAPPWRVVYEGPAAKYAVEALVPADVLAKEPGVVVAANFVVQTLGTEYGWDREHERVVPSPEPSLRSAVLAAVTVNPKPRAAEWDSRTRQKIREAIVLDEDAGHTIDCFDNREFASVGRSQHYR